MAWVRYDDGFYSHPKVTAVIAEDPAALSLHVLANTWTNAQKRPGYVPAHQPGILVADKTIGNQWATLLAKHDLWHDVKKMCDECLAEFEDLASGTGYVIHDAKKYRAPDRDRTTPGTPAELSEKRRAAGRKGGKTTAGKRSNGKQNVAKPATGQANQANGAAEGSGREVEATEPEAGTAPAATDIHSRRDESQRPAETKQDARASAADADSKSSKLLLAGVSKNSNLLFGGVSPEPEPVVTDASNEASAADPGGTDDETEAEPVTARTILGEYIDRCRKRPPQRVLGQMAKEIKNLLEDDFKPDDIRRGIAQWMTKDTHPSVLPSIVNSVVNGNVAPLRPTGTDGSATRGGQRNLPDPSEYGKGNLRI
jgi:hypothetical protein